MTTPEYEFSVARFSLAVVVPAIVAVAFTYLSAAWAAQYGWTLFLFTPILIGFLSSVIFSPDGRAGYFRCLATSLLSIALIALAIIAVAIEGLVCLVMAMPLALALDALGVLIGFGLTVSIRDARARTLASFLMIAALPLLFGFETSTKSRPTVHEVVSTVEVDAPIDKVWRSVIEFPRIDAQPEGILSLGFAYPIDAKIEGNGVGAVRYCNFNTGPFVEPITDWQEPNLLAFDVREQPAPMIELTPYQQLHAAHLDYIRSRKGQFRLYEKDGKTVVEGTTFYTHDIAPDVYWNLFSDQIIRRIHMRVLNHIKEVSER